MLRHRPNKAVIAALVATLTLTAAACGSATSTTTHTTAMSGMNMSGTTSNASMPGMNMSEAVPGDGLLAAYAGFTLAPMTSQVTAGQAATYQFRITQPGGTALTAYQVEQTKLLHFYVIRTDLTGFEHLHPTLGPDGTWTVTINPATAGSYRIFTQFNADPGNKVTPLVLSEPLTVTGPATADQPLPAPSATTSIDGYSVAFTGTAKAGSDSMLTANITNNGQPVTNLQPYLDVYAHLTAFHQDDLAFAHLHPMGTVNGDHGGPTLTFHADFAKTGNYRVFIQFQTDGVLHTAAITIPVT